jgi:hypothetical protein
MDQDRTGVSRGQPLALREYLSQDDLRPKSNHGCEYRAAPYAFLGPWHGFYLRLSGCG